MNEKNLIIDGFSDKYLRMKVNSGTKMKNVLRHALKHFPHQYNKIIWTGAGQAVGKVISCVELLKRKNPGLHQVTKLRYIDSNNNTRSISKKSQIPEINIFLSQETMCSSESGYQSAGDEGIFRNSSIHIEMSQKIKLGQDIENEGAISSSVAEEIAALGLRTSQKRPQRSHMDNFPVPKKKKGAKKEVP